MFVAIRKYNGVIHLAYKSKLITVGPYTPTLVFNASRSFSLFPQK